MLKGTIIVAAYVAAIALLIAGIAGIAEALKTTSNEG
jgi:preprotein translocase subunit SecE